MHGNPRLTCPQDKVTCVSPTVCCGSWGVFLRTRVVDVEHMGWHPLPQIGHTWDKYHRITWGINVRNSSSVFMLKDGASRTRTGDLLLAKQALSHLSYGPAGLLNNCYQYSYGVTFRYPYASYITMGPLWGRSPLLSKNIGSQTSKGPLWS